MSAILRRNSFVVVSRVVVILSMVAVALWESSLDLSLQTHPENNTWAAIATVVTATIMLICTALGIEVLSNAPGRDRRFILRTAAFLVAASVGIKWAALLASYIFSTFPVFVTIGVTIAATIVGLAACICSLSMAWVRSH